MKNNKNQQQVEKLKTDFEKWLDDQEDYNHKTFKGKIIRFYENYIYYPAKRLIRKPGEIKDDLIAFYQRGKNGFAIRDCWGVDYYLTNIIPKMLAVMIDEKKGGGNSYPGEPYGKEADTLKHWHKTINTIIEGFEAQEKITEEWIPLTSKEGKILLEKVNKGMQLFVKYYVHLWD